MIDLDEHRAVSSDGMARLRSQPDDQLSLRDRKVLVLGEGELFVAIRGAKNDGHDYIPEAFARGAVGAHAAAVFMEQIAFLGGGRNEAPAVWLGSNGVTQKISTREIEQILSSCPLDFVTP